jgi:hypothetical protein
MQVVHRLRLVDTVSDGQGNRDRSMLFVSVNIRSKSMRSRSNHPWRSTLIAFLAGLVYLAGPVLPQLHAQIDSAQATPDTAAITAISAPVIDTIVIRRSNVFSDEEETNGIFRFMNKIHIVTQPWVIQQDIRLEVGEPYDSMEAAETTRLLLDRQIFRSVSIDTSRFGDQLGLVVETQDAWSLKPKFALSAASDGTVTYTVGVNDVSLLGTGNQLYGAYQKQVDRQGWNLSADFGRVFGTEIDIVGNYSGMSDGKNGNWSVGSPFRFMVDDRALTYSGSAADQRIFRFGVEEGGQLDSLTFQNTAFINRLSYGWAVNATSRSYLRFVAIGGVRSQTYVRQLDSIPAVGDSVFGTVGGLVNFRSGRFHPTSHFNGFGQESIDLSSEAYVSLALAPEAFGYQRTGVGPGVGGVAARNWESTWVWASLQASGMFDSSGLDSARVIGNIAFGTKMADRLAFGFQVQGGYLDNTAPGTEFDLGFQNVLRSWEPHSFVGQRTVWGTAEQRWYVWDKLFNLIGIGFAGFVDYGGAWYPEQEARFGGNVGVGLRMGGTLSAIARTSRIDLGYRFGDDVTGSRWAVSFGAGFVFPWREIPVTCYQAVPPQVVDCPRYIR